MKIFLDTARIDEIREAAKADSDAATLPFNVLKQLVEHPLTEIGLKWFLADWDHYLKEGVLKGSGDLR